MDERIVLSVTCGGGVRYLCLGLGVFLIDYLLTCFCVWLFVYLIEFDLI